MFSKEGTIPTVHCIWFTAKYNHACHVVANTLTAGCYFLTCKNMPLSMRCSDTWTKCTICHPDATSPRLVSLCRRAPHELSPALEETDYALEIHFSGLTMSSVLGYHPVYRKTILEEVLCLGESHITVKSRSSNAHRLTACDIDIVSQTQESCF